jgi:serine/threonine-protein kinase
VIAPERFARVDELFDAALDRPVQERSAWLRDVCASDPDLRVEVEALLKLAESDDALVDSGALQGPIWEDLARELQSLEELSAGDRVGPYEIRDLIGRGGMGAVYRARDLTLDRDVAVKALNFLNRGFPPDASTLRRFEREAKLLASLNHPNIAAIYDFLQVGERSYLVLELVDGETLSSRLTRGPLELAEAVRVATELAQALEEAHRKGVVHRDLKPSNVKLTPEGRVKVLDFGLAKAEEESGEPDRQDRDTPTLGAPTTQSGVILGTPGYMSPEQVRGLGTDKRADIWAFGCLLYEMLSGARAFTGGTVSDALAASLRDEVDWGRLPASVPPGLERLLRRCLKQHTRERLQDIGDARIELEELARGDSAEVSPGRRPSRLSTAALASAALLAFLLGAAFFRVLARREAPANRSVMRTSLLLEPGTRLWQGASSSIALSADGSRVAFVGQKDERTNLYVRSLDSYQAFPVAASEGARDPFFSPDGEWVGFFAGGEIRRVHLASGSPSSVAKSILPLRGASWGADGRVLFAQDGAKGLFVVPASGGTPEVLLAPDPGEDATEYRWPQWLSGQRKVLFTTIRIDASGITDQLAVLDLDTDRVHVVGRGTQGVFVPSGHILYTTGGALEAVSFDMERMGAAGGSFRVVDSVHGYPAGAMSFSVSPSGALLYVEPPLTGTLDWIDRAGVKNPVQIPRGTPGWPRVSPNERYAAIHVGGPETRDVWILDLDRPGTLRQLTYRGGGFPVWSHDGRRIAFMSRQEGSGDIYVVLADGSGTPERVVAGERTKIPVSWSAAGVLAYYEIGEANQRDIWVVDLEGDRIPQPFVATPANELSPVFSPDGRRIAYVSNETGQNEVYVRPFPPPGPVTAVSIDGGSEPAWSRDGKALFYRHGDTLMSVSVRSSARLEVGRPTTAVGVPLLPGSGGNASYDVASDGQRFLMLRPATGTSAEELRLVLNWAEALPAQASR